MESLVSSPWVLLGLLAFGVVLLVMLFALRSVLRMTKNCLMLAVLTIVGLAVAAAAAMWFLAR
jgi:hypothetical protein